MLPHGYSYMGSSNSSSSPPAAPQRQQAAAPACSSPAPLCLTSIGLGGEHLVLLKQGPYPEDVDLIHLPHRGAPTSFSPQKGATPSHKKFSLSKRSSIPPHKTYCASSVCSPAAHHRRRGAAGEEEQWPALRLPAPAPARPACAVATAHRAALQAAAGAARAFVGQAAAASAQSPCLRPAAPSGCRWRQCHR